MDTLSELLEPLFQRMTIVLTVAAFVIFVIGLVGNYCLRLFGFDRKVGGEIVKYLAGLTAALVIAIGFRYVLP